MHAASVQIGAGLGQEIPVALARVVGGPTNGLPYLGDVVPPAGLQQQYLDARVLGESARYDRAGRTGPTDDEIVVAFERGAKLALVQTNSFGERALICIRCGVLDFGGQSGCLLCPPGLLEYPPCTYCMRLPTRRKGLNSLIGQR